MKIGILTYHRTLNYGACLQALATRFAMENMGHNVFYVNYWPIYHKYGYSIFNYRRFRSDTLKGKVKYLYDCSKNAPFQIIRKINFGIFFHKYILPYCKPLSEEYDVVIYGSDQIWRKQNVLNTYDPIFFADRTIRSKKYVAFSASMGIVPDTNTDKMQLIPMLQRFSRISVRESSLKVLLSELNLNDVTLTIDPTLLLTADMWISRLSLRISNTGKYLLVYALHPEVFSMPDIYRFAHKKRLQVKVISGSASSFGWQDHLSRSGPKRFLELIMNAEFVCSSSFHGVAFSLIFNKQFIASFTNNSDRVHTLLCSLDISDRMVPIKFKFDTELPPIDYIEVNRKLLILRAKSLNYLKTI